MAATTFDLANLVLGGRLNQKLRRWRDQGRTLDTIAADLRAQGIDVSRETVRRWYLALEKGAA